MTDVAVGDTIEMSTSGAISFIQPKVTLSPVAVFRDYANAAVARAATAAGNIACFEYRGDTYIVQNQAGPETSFTGGSDLIVKLSGMVDLNRASLVTGAATLLIL